MAKPLLERPFDLFICILYTVQVPMALLFDSQAILPRSWYPKALVDVMQWYVEEHQDPLVRVPCVFSKNNSRKLFKVLMTQHGAWYVGIGYYELLIQVPFWTVAAIAYAQGKHSIRLPNFVFSLCSLIIMIPIMSELLYTEVKYNRSVVISTYLPFAIAPALIALKTLFYDGIFGAQAYAKKSV